MSDVQVTGEGPRPGPDVSRRVFVRGAAGVIAGGLVVSTGLLEFGGSALAGPAPSLTRATFDKCVGQSFTLKSAAVPSLVLFKSRSLPFVTAPQPPGAAESFSLLFKGAANKPLPQDVYTFDHSRTGKFTVLVAPMRPEADARYYEVIFNRAAPR